MIRQYELIELIRAYDPQVNEDMVNRAYVYAMKMHGSQKRASGDPYFSHPLEVAGILTEMKMDTASICTALLHDTVEDTAATLEDIKRLFGEEICRLVDGVTKLSKIEFQSAQEKQAENFRKLVLAMSEDIRVLLVKLADRLHNMRTLHHVKPEKQRRIALETLEIYAPLAERIGIHKIKEELEDIAFGVLNPEARESILARLTYLRAEGGEEAVQRIINTLKEKIAEAGIQGDISGREKTRYSIWKKMQRKNISFEQLSDIMAFRIIVPNITECYHALGVIHGLYPTVPGRFKDYISLPKPNGYRSLHTTVIGPENHRIEMQIRTPEMHEEAELGVAAHWSYKQQDGKTEGRQYRWLRELMDIVEHAQKPEEFLEHTKMELYQDQVFCFTPNGDLIALPRCATPIDFAYAVHSTLGDTTVGAKVNGRIVPLNTQLVNGDQVDITTSKSQTPSPNWERFVVTGKAKARIRRFIRQQQHEEYLNLGKAMLQKVLKQEGHEYNEKRFSNDFCRQFKAENLNELLIGIGSGHISSRDVFYTLHPENKPKDPVQTVQSIMEVVEKKTHQKSKSTPMPIKGIIPGMALHFARCCHPLPGDRIVGIVMTGKGVTIHTIDCETLESFADTPERWLDVSWEDGEDSPESHVGRLIVTIANTPGSLGNLSTVIGKNGGNITNLKIVNRSLDFWDMMIDVYVRDSKHLSDIISAMRATPEITAVNRARSR